MEMVTGQILFSYEDVVQTLVLEGLTRLTVWEQTFDTIKNVIINELNVAVVNCFIVLRSALLSIDKKLNQRELSEYKIINLKDTELSPDDIIDYFRTALGEKFTSKEIGFDCVKRLKELVKDSIKSSTNNNNVVNDNETDESKIDDDDDGDDDNNSSSDEFNKSINLILNKNKKKIKKGKKHINFEQSFQLSVDGERKWLKTPGEEGLYMIEIIVTDTRDIENEKPDEWWKKINKKIIFLAQSSKDPLFVSVKNVLKIGLNRIKNVPNVKSGSFAMGQNRFKPY